MSGHHHRAGSLSQSNKKNKRTKASKRSVSRENGGKVGGRVRVKHGLLGHTNRVDRRHILDQKKEAKRLLMVRHKRGSEGAPAPPRVVGIISLGESEVTEERLRSLILDQADRVLKPYGDDNDTTTTAKFDVHKKEGNLTVLTNSSAFRSHYARETNGDDAAVLAALDLCRVCDLILFVIDGNGARPGDDVLGISIGGDDPSTTTNKTSSTSQDWDHLISARGDRILSAVKGQGLPRPLTVLARTEKDQEVGEDHMTTQSAKSLRRSNLKRKTDLKKYVCRFSSSEFGVDNEKVVEVDLTETMDDDEMEQEGTADPGDHVKRTLAAALVRTLCTMSASASKWVANSARTYMLSDNHHYNPATQELQVTGYVRGLVPFDVNALMHIPNLGTFACKSLKKAIHPHAGKKTGASKMDNSLEVFESDPMKRESLEMFAAPDALEGEQNLIGFDEEDEHFDEQEEEEDEQDSQKNVARPAGWSDYQSSWLDAVDDVSVAEGELDHGELAKELNKKSTESVAPDDDMDIDDDNQISKEERQDLLEQRRKEAHEHNEFPDEVQVDEDEKARDRFARYRSLKSFRKSHWDPKENLPDSYASVFHFKSFKTTQRSVMAEMKDLSKAARSCDDRFWNGELKAIKGGKGDVSMDADSDEENDDILEGCVPSGSYITLTIEGVSQTAYAGLAPNALIAVVTLLSHENKVSVLHMSLSQSPSCEMSMDAPVKSKDILTFRCGWRTWTGRPVFSQHNLNCDKHKFERFLPQAGAYFAASVFGPVTYTQCPVLVFREHDGRKELVAIGSMIGADADRVVVKRIVLTGFPVRVHKRFATVKYMFYSPEDVEWFKPAGLTTKHGLQGNILQSVGDHGTMKVLFNAPIKQHDTVCLPLYKRIYPKFAGVNMSGEDGGTVRSIKNRNILVVR
jgi:pre-rRNA-processing protein TSR1